MLFAGLSLVFIQVFAGYVIFGHFAGAHFPLAAVSGLFDARDHSSLESVSLFDQLIDTFRIGAFGV